jgi:hypothetical protein
VFFQCGPRGSKSRLAKAAVRSHLVKWKMRKNASNFRKRNNQNISPSWRFWQWKWYKVYMEIKVRKINHSRSIIGSWTKKWIQL